eukprot:UN10586
MNADETAKSFQTYPILAFEVSIAWIKQSNSFFQNEPKFFYND